MVKDSNSLTRRELLLLLAGVILAVALPEQARAKDGDSGNSGSGSSGGGGGDDDGGDDDGGDDDGNHDDNDHNDARDAVRRGEAISLSKAMSYLKNAEPGRVVEVELVKRSSGFDYRFKVVGTSGKVKTINMDAASGRIRSFLGL